VTGASTLTAVRIAPSATVATRSDWLETMPTPEGGRNSPSTHRILGRWRACRSRSHPIASPASGTAQRSERSIARCSRARSRRHHRRASASRSTRCTIELLAGARRQCRDALGAFHSADHHGRGAGGSAATRAAPSRRRTRQEPPCSRRASPRTGSEREAKTPPTADQPGVTRGVAVVSALSSSSPHHSPQVRGHESATAVVVTLAGCREVGAAGEL